MSELPNSRMPPGYSESDFVFGKAYKCVNVIGQNVMCNIVRNVYSHDSIQSDDGHMTLNNYFKKNNWSERKKKDFKKFDNEWLEKDLNDINFDITFGHKVLTDVCGDLIAKLSEKCLSSLGKLKTLRNKVCHNYGISDSELPPIVKNLDRILQDIYTGVGELLHLNYETDIEMMRKQLKDICQAKVKQDDFESYLEDVRWFRNSKKFMMINGGRSELQKYYDQLQILNPCTWMTNEEISKTSLSKYQIDKVFTPLKIEDRRQEIDMKNILQITTRFCGAERFPTALLMHGLAGCGKTSLSHYILHEWRKDGHCSNIDTLEDYNLVIFVEVRRVRSKQLETFLKEECLRNTCRDFDSSDIIPTLQDLEVLFVIDGFDEAKKGLSLGLVEDIFCKFDHSRIIMTTRPEYQGDAERMARKHRVSYLPIQICGFDEKRLRMFSEKVFRVFEPNEDRCRKQLKEFLNYVDGPGMVLNEHLRLPLTLSLLIYLWRDNPQIVLKVSSATQLYSEIFNLCQKRLKERIDDLGRDDLDSLLKRALLCLGEQAWSLLLEGNLICLSKKEEDNMKKGCGNKRIASQVLSAYLCCEKEENQDLKEGIFAFLHRTQMEYMAGAYLASAINERKLDFQDIEMQVNESQAKEWRKVLEVVKYITGTFANTETLNKNKISKISSILNSDSANVSSSNFNFWWTLLVESLKDWNMGKTIVDESLPQCNWKLDHLHVVSGLSLYHVAPICLETMTIDIPIDVDAYDIKGLLPLLKMIKQLKFKEKKKGVRIQPVKIELHFWNHESYYTKPSDEFINTLHPWGHLTNFTGCLEGEVLGYSSKLKTVRVRLNTLEAVKAFQESLKKIFKSIRVLRVTLGIPLGTPPSELCQFLFTDKFELTLTDTKDEHIQWIIDVVKRINGRNGCNRLHLLNTEIGYSSIEKMLNRLKGVIYDKISLDTIHRPNEEQMEKLLRLQNKVHIDLNWLDP